MHYGYRGLKIFTSLSLRFQDFQRLREVPNALAKHFVDMKKLPDNG